MMRKPDKHGFASDKTLADAQGVDVYKASEMIGASIGAII